MSLSPRGLCLGLCCACAALVLRLWACAPGNPFHAAHPLGRLVPSGLRVLRLWAPCPLARASLGPCAPFCVRPRSGCAEHPLGLLYVALRLCLMFSFCSLYRAMFSSKSALSDIAPMLPRPSRRPHRQLEPSTRPSCVHPSPQHES